MRTLVTGGTGFVGGRLVRRLRERGDAVVALVRSPERAGDLETLGCELAVGDVTDRGSVARAVRGCDAVFHAAADYRVGIPAAEAPAMERVNVGGTEIVLEESAQAGVARIVYVSTIAAFGDTGGRVVDESHEPGPDDLPTFYDRTKHAAHRVAQARAAAGDPVLIAQPGVVYGPGDTSQNGEQVRAAMAGRLPYVGFPDLGVNAGHVDDIAAGLLLVHDRGRVGEAYVIGGQLTTMRGVLGTAARAAGRRPPRLALGPGAVGLIAPLGPLLARFGMPPNLGELAAMGRGTYWATDTKARRELGYEARDLVSGMCDTAAAGAAAP